MQIIDEILKNQSQKRVWDMISNTPWFDMSAIDKELRRLPTTEPHPRNMLIECNLGEDN